MNAYITWIQELIARVNISRGMPWFVRGVYLWLAINALSLVPVYDLIWGEDCVFQRLGQLDGLINNVVYHLVYSKRYAFIVFHGHWVLALVSVFQFKWVSLARLAVWVTGLMLYFSATEVFNSGMMLMLVMSFYLIAYNPGRNANWRWINTGVYLLCVAQVIIVYFVSAFFKLQGEQWLQGDILYFVVQTPHFVSASIRDSALISWNFALALLSYLALAYQLLFPLLVFWKRGAWIFISIGMLFHLSIAFFMHLYDFGFAMLVCYALFIPSQLKST